jgi:RNA polymerase sigma-70 factor (ECF subfamily)
LLHRYQAGDAQALDALFRRVLPPLARWARGRLPQQARGMLDTVDIVQDALFQSLRHLAGFEPRHDGALQAYLRQAVLNRVRDEARKVARRPEQRELVDEHESGGQSALERVIGREGLERYERALARLREQEREAIIARLEWQQSYEEVAQVLGKPTANAARVAVTRAVARLIEEMGDDG